MQRWASAASVVLVVIFLVFVWGRLVDRMIFYPEPGADLRPEQLGIEGEDVRILTEDGVRIHAFFLPFPGATRAVLFLHGNAGNASHRLPNAAELMRLGSHVLLLDYRGYGLSDGSPDEAGVYADARAGLAHLVGNRDAHRTQLREAQRLYEDLGATGHARRLAEALGGSA